MIESPGVILASSPFRGLDAVFFVAMILAMAIIPLISGAWWRKWYPLVVLAIALPCAVVVGTRHGAALAVAAEEYLSFILLVGSLYVIAGGIDLEIPARGRPGSNVMFLLAGAVLANFLGTTGASVVLIRPLLRANSSRKQVVHLCVFFIILVSNIGGLLTPLGDPPLFLGYLHGVPFFWTLKLFPIWAISVGVLLAAFWVLDSILEGKESGTGGFQVIDREGHLKFELRGFRNVLLLLLVMASLFLPPLLRAIVMTLALSLSILFTPSELRKRNDFTYHPIVEVAVLFAGIFVTLIPVQSLMQSFPHQGFPLSPLVCFWTAGGLSSFLDNAPTYLIFFQALHQAAGAATTLVAGVPEPLLMAIASGCVMMGANTYIGNGPNLMVKAICEDEGVKMPSFMGYMGWAALVLVPLYALVSWVFM